ncbi:MAG: 4-hydroxythreonine-4-phosphate dehydrogenase PdxA [Gammaproteobacteria bacterium]|nr:4-hydroxythreonine-4-phosphate dehydrogenase PdxA [Gammaproteobacteria bacterium]
MSKLKVDWPRIALTSGEPAGIGPELCAQLLAHHSFECELICLGDRDLLTTRAQVIGLKPPALIQHHALRERSEAGQIAVVNVPYVLDLLNAALEGVANRQFAAIVTAPLQKNIIIESGVPFKGHTEYFAAATHSAHPVMLLVADQLRIALATTHLPLRAVPSALSIGNLLATLNVMHHDLKNKFGISAPRILVCGLNPHAGENGQLGDEEINIISPAIALAQAQGINAFGPIPADTAFIPRELARADAILAMYHDQGLPVLKHAGFGHAVNVTLGLPLIRTSVDHGTALNLAGTGRADCGSLAAAVELAIKLIHRQRATN